MNQSRPPSTIPERPEPCRRCGVRADIGCAHQPAQGEPPPAVAEFGKPAKPHANAKPGGHSPWGKHGNPAGPARERMERNLRSLFK